MCGGSLHAMEIKNDIASEQVFVFKHTSFIKAKIYFCSLHFWLIIILVPNFFFYQIQSLKLKKRSHFNPYYRLNNGNCLREIASVANEVHH